ncbi:SpoIIE family protein phosphatase [Streptomyces capillispiralis]|uniref:protein-serine/threonine phosphatase n=1 Tax=Streptomyces capillispiralis TaxID=68182 RepID=A0A561TRA4_9ACTN|nr:SpoIIE family protein phosphatase [Streptomyces capillispiralis]TWF89643.1 GAF domain-containing protein [Streptomyces capillispiralis]GHH93962.1 diguanylate cyclase [Streptomyces capillispiralis]
MDDAAAVPPGERPAGVLGGGAEGEGGAAGGRGGAARIEDALAEAVVAAVQDLEGYGGLVYLRSRDRRSLVLCVVCGVPRSLLRSWWRVPVGGALPMSEAYRGGESLWLPDEAATMLRFPQFTAALPYSFASAYHPVRVGGEPVGVLAVLRSANREPVGERTVRAVLRGAGRDMEERLTEFARQVPGRTDPDAVAYGIDYDDQPVSVRLPTPPARAVSVGMIEWDLDSDRWSGDDDALALLGVARADFGGTTAEVEDRVSPDDLYELRASRREAADTGQVRGRHFRVLDEPEVDGRMRYRPVELWGHVVRAEGATRLLVGALVDAAGGATAAEAAERLPDGVFSLDQDGRVVYANLRCQELLRCELDRMLGHYPWEVLTWLRDPAYEDRYRAAMLSQEPVSYLVHDPEGDWLGFVLYPGVHGLTGRVFPTSPPAGAEPGRALSPAGGAVAAPPSGLVGTARAGALYHVVQMASVLTEAVTVRDVCRAVAEQLLPGFGAQEIALYTIRDNRMHLLWESGYPEHFLDRFEGVPLDADLPGVHALTTRLPLFFESPEALADTYSGLVMDQMSAWSFLPLIASGHPVGSCILGWSAPHRFTPEERSALTALGGLTAQAMERARLYDAESAVARGLQEGLLPHRLPVIDRMLTTGRYLPGTQGMAIGGDWYDVIRTGRGVALVIGDVEGHSVGAAAVMGQLRSAVHAFAASGRPPQEVITHTNRLLAELEADVFATCCYIELDPGTGRALAVRAGHPPPLLRHPDGRTESLDLPGGVLLGVQPDAVYPVTELTLAPGSVLALYTDGLVETPGGDIETGIEAVRGCLARSRTDSVEQLADRLIRIARRTEDRPDDVALLLTAYDWAGAR